MAAIRGWMRDRVEVSDATFALYQKIAATRILPSGVELSFTTGWTGFKGFDFDVWWVDLEVSTGVGTGYNYRLRDRKLGSRPSAGPVKPEPGLTDLRR